MFNHNEDSISAAIGIAPEVLSQERTQLLIACLNIMSQGTSQKASDLIPDLIIQYEEKPKILLAYLLQSVRTSLADQIFMTQEPDLMSILPCFITWTYDVRSREIEELTSLSNKLLAELAVSHAVALVNLTAAKLNAFLRNIQTEANDEEAGEPSGHLH